MRRPMEAAGAAGGTGFFGKVPSQGDFVASRFDRSLRDPLDRWAQRALLQARRERGEGWKYAFLAMPPWRFALGAALAGGEPAIGVMVPSQDRVGRPFPLFLGTRLQGHRGPVRFLARQRRWFETAEALALEARGAAMPLDRLDRDLAALRPDPGTAHALEDGAQTSRDDRDRSFWWTDGHPPRRFAASGFPAPEEFAHFLADGTAEPAPPSERAPAPVSPPTAAVPAPSQPPPVAVATRSHPGTRLRLDADGVLVAEGNHLLAVAGGQGSLTATPAAARLALERLGRAAPLPRIADLTAEVKGALGSANTLLRREGGGALPPGGIGVIALALAPDGFAAVWAGDLRCYLLRAGTMRLLTRDHVAIGLERRLTRSLGGSAQFSCDVAGGRAEPGDVFLLATGSLTRTLSEREVAGHLIGDDPEAAVRALVDDALVAGVRENLSVVVASLR